MLLLTSFISSSPFSVFFTTLIDAPHTADIPTCSYQSRCDSLPTITSSDCLQCTPTHIRLPIVPLGTYRPFSFPARCATFSSNSIVVGSSTITSSPTLASAIAFLISTLGTVTVSDRKSAMTALDEGEERAGMEEEKERCHRDVRKGRREERRMGAVRTEEMILIFSSSLFSPLPFLAQPLFSLFSFLLFFPSSPLSLYSCL
mmetsp:Transcript_24513/g.62070  ORF Transcript_24513/g.62070 Transcript_24513/m.62070 type:complete len:202 (+) Transcript_24513:831-1436(+)